MITRLVLFALVASSCGAPQSEPRPSEAPLSEASDVEAAASAPSLSDIMLELVRGSRSIASLVDRERGLVHVSVRSDPTGEDPRIGPDGLVRIAERYCGAALDEAVERLDRDLRARNPEPPDEPAFECEGRVCRHPALMEYDVSGAYTFAPDQARLLQVVQIETALSDEAQADAERWIETQLARLEGGRCP